MILIFKGRPASATPFEAHENRISVIGVISDIGVISVISVIPFL